MVPWFRNICDKYPRVYFSLVINDCSQCLHFKTSYTEYSICNVENWEEAVDELLEREYKEEYLDGTKNGLLF